MILVVWLVTTVVVRFRVLVFSCTSATARGSAASSVVVDLGFCGVSMTDLRFSSDQLCSARRRTFRAYTTVSSVRAKCSSVRSLATRQIFHLSANFGAGVPDPFQTSGRCARTVSPNSTSFPRYGPPMARKNGDCTSLTPKRGMSQAACRTIHLIKALSAVGLYCVRSCIAASIVRCCPCSCFMIIFDSSVALM